MAVPTSSSLPKPSQTLHCVKYLSLIRLLYRRGHRKHAPRRSRLRSTSPFPSRFPLSRHRCQSIVHSLAYCANFCAAKNCVRMQNQATTFFCSAAPNFAHAMACVPHQFAHAISCAFAQFIVVAKRLTIRAMSLFDTLRDLCTQKMHRPLEK